MALEVIGPHPFEVDAAGRQLTRIGTVFPEHNCLYTRGPGVHAWQRVAFLEELNVRRNKAGQSPLSPEQEEHIATTSVDLVFEPQVIMIRSNPENMELTFAADELLQQLVSKRQIRFLSVSNPRVKEAIRERGENWRLSLLPKSREAKQKLIWGSKVAIHGQPIYFYNSLTGTRWLTFEQFKNLEKLGDADLAQHLQEIAAYAALTNRSGRPELSFFAADIGRFDASCFSNVVFKDLPSEELRKRHRDLCATFRSAVHEAFRQDDPSNKSWSERMISALFLEGNEAQTEQILSGLSPEFFLQVEWLPGGRFEEGEFLFDSVFDESANTPNDADLQRLCDPRSKGIIFNLIREYGDLQYINIGCVRESLSLERPQTEVRRGVYIAEFKSMSRPDSIRRIIRLQKWGVWEHLDEGKEMLEAIHASDEYTDYWLDRRLGCRQLGMNLTPRVIMRRLSETYKGINSRYYGQSIRTTYFEREFLVGIATDKVPTDKYLVAEYALRLAAVLGKAAASSIIVGRSFALGTKPVFDDGDELIRESLDSVAAEIMVGDHSGAFGEYKLPLEHFAAHYAKPVNKRENLVPDPKAFAETYLSALTEQFLHIQGDYRKRRRAFDTLFKHCRYDTGGSFAYRWEQVLYRLDHTDVAGVVSAIRKYIHVLSR